MDCMRINCAHDDVATWLRMIEHLRRAERSLGRSCRVVMDLGGPKLRTGPIEPGPAVVRIRPRRDVYGRVTAPARVWLTAETIPQPPPSPAGRLPPRAGGVAGSSPRGGTREIYRRPRCQAQPSRRRTSPTADAGPRRPGPRISSPAPSCVTRAEWPAVTTATPPSATCRRGENAIPLRQGDLLIADARPQAGPPRGSRQRRANPDSRFDRLHDSGGIRRRPAG